jgi:uncharacterized protein YukJ
MIIDFDTIYQIIVNQTKNKKNLSAVFLISLNFAENLASVTNDFGEKIDQQLTQLIAEFADVAEEPQGL